MKNFIQNFLKALQTEKIVEKIVYVEKPYVPPIVIKSNREKLLDIATSALGTDPTPKDEQPDEYACVHSLTTLMRNLIPDFPIMTYTPTFLTKLQSDLRFKASTELKEGNIVISPTNTGNGQIVGHTGIVGKNGKILSNASSTGLWSDKFDTISWIERYSRQGKLSLYIFELV